jgi:hypothetical protein
MIHHDKKHRTGRRRKPRTLYFDIDGTLVQQTFSDAKRRLGGGAFERAVRRAGFDRLVCVSDAATIARTHLEAGLTTNPHDVVFELCRGTIEDRQWFDTHVALAPDPTQRARSIDPREDWYYVDDWARRYLWRSLPRGRARRMLRSGRVLRCAGGGTGQDVLDWLASLTPAPPSGRPAPSPRGRRATPTPTPPPTPAYAH